MRSGKKGSLSLLLALVLILPSLLYFTAAAGETHVFVLAGSDFQEGTHAGSAAVVSAIADAVKADGFTDVDGFLFSGDYDRNTIGNSSETAAGLAALDNVVTASFPTLRHKVYAQGNHDPASVAGLAASGAHDAENYGVYVINNKDYMWYNSDEATIRKTAASLRAYFEEKEEAGYTKPIFVVSHLPLHYSMRTSVDGDAQYANYLFDELNEAGALGLNVVFLFGHDHSHGWDNHLGGSAIFLNKGDRINIAQAQRGVFTRETLNFIYMNAGYTGYYSSADGADDALTMTLFEIAGDELTVRRYDQNGLHDLKSAGTYCSEYDDRAILGSDKTVYPGEMTVGLNATVLSKSWYEDDAFGIAAYYTGCGIEVCENTDAAAAFFGDPEAFESYTAYTVSPVGDNVGKAKLRIPYDEFGDGPVRLYVKSAEGYERAEAEKENGRMVIYAELPVDIALAVPDDPVARSAYADYLFLMKEESDGLYFMHAASERYLTCDGNATFGATGAALTVTAVSGGYKIALKNATGGKSAGDALHFGTANRCSFGEYSPFVFYEFLGDDRFAEDRQPQDGMICLVVYKNGGALCALTGRVNGTGTSSRIETGTVSLNTADPDRVPYENSAYLPYLYKVGTLDGALTFKHLDTSAYLSCSGNATLSSSPAKFSVSAYGAGVKAALAGATGGKAAGDALHLGSGERVSFGDATALTFFEYAGNDTFRAVEIPAAGSVVMFVFEKNGVKRALSGTVYNSGTSSRIETGAVEIAEAPVRDPFDLDKDGGVTITDVTVLLDRLAGNKQAIAAGADPDVNGDGFLTISDVTCLLDALSRKAT